jgi:two-component system OmpR family response regulator
MLRPGKVLTRSYIEDHIYDENKELMSNVVESAISHLRKKLAQAGSHARIETKRGFGYYLDVSPSA